MKLQEYPEAPSLSKLVHDIRNELNAIVMNAELARMLVQQQGPGEAAVKALEVILDKSSSCDRLLEEMQGPD